MGAIISDMDYENYMELYEAVYFFDRLKCCADNESPRSICNEEAKRLGIKAKLELGLPGRVAPKKAAMYIKNTLDNIMEEIL